MPKRSILDAKVSIDIGKKSVRIIKTNLKGKIVRAATADLPDDVPEAPGAQYTLALTQAIKAAAKEARATRGSNCVMVVGGPHIIARSFTWPEMPPDALYSNAMAEIAPYLPDAAGQYAIHYTVMRRITDRSSSTGTPVVQLDVMVAAIAKNMLAALLHAARKAGFTPMRVDIRENARGKLLHAMPPLGNKSPEGFVFDPKKSYAVLDIADTLVNMTVFINGVFYANRYFGSQIRGSDSLGESGAFTESAENSSDTAVDPDLLANEVSSIIDYINYRERGSTVESVFIFGNSKKVSGILTSLSENLNIPVISSFVALAKDVIPPKKLDTIDITNYLDALGAMTPKQVSLYADMDLDYRPSRHIFKRIVLPSTGVLLVLGTVMAISILVPLTKIQLLKLTEQGLDEELAKYTVSAMDVATLSSEVQTLRMTSAEISAFFTQYALASEVLQAIYDAIPSGAVISKISISDGTVSLSASASSFNMAADFIVALREDQLFTSVDAQFARSYPEMLTPVDFDITLKVAEGSGHFEKGDAQ